MPWKVLLKIIEPHYPVAGRGRKPYALESMLGVHLMQNWFALSDRTMGEALYEITSLRAFARLRLHEPIPDETTILNFRHMLEANDIAEDMLKAINALLSRKGLLFKRGSIVDATIIAAPSSTKNAEGERDPEKQLPPRRAKFCCNCGKAQTPAPATANPIAEPTVFAQPMSGQVTATV